ncbi:uncharacterized protein ACJ7VT_008238 [Polymixia lowei]
MVLGVRTGLGVMATGVRSIRVEEGCGSLQRPAVFTSVAALRGWIQEQVGAELDQVDPADQRPGTRNTSQQVAMDNQGWMGPGTYVEPSSDDEDYDAESSGWEE